MTEKFTLESLRKRTLSANRGFADREAAERADRQERAFWEALAVFEKDAAEQSAKGKTSAIGGEFMLSEGKSTLDAEDRALWNRLKTHYEGMGFKTRVHGPYVDGGPSHVYHGLDLIVDWS
jgi:hypothetical protein